MTINLSNIKWGWVGLGVMIAFVIAFGSSICMVTGYAAYLGFQARGTPDMTLINAFAAKTAGPTTSIFLCIGTLVGGFLAGRKAKHEAFQNGLMVGLITAFVELLLSIFGGFSLWAMVPVVLAAGGGWLGGTVSSQQT